MEMREASLLRIYCSEDDIHGGRPLYQALLRAAHEAKLGGATVLRGVAGYGPGSFAIKYFQLSTEGRPLVIEIMESDEKVEAFLPTVETMVESGAVSIERVRFAALAPR